MKRFKTLQAVLSTAALLGTVAIAHAAPTNITTRDGRGADATVQGGEFATRNIGTHPLWVKNSRLSNFVRNFYLRFDLAKATTPLANLEKAEIQLTTIAPVGAT